MPDDAYETSDPLTFGGATGQYVIPSPWHTECEWCLISALALGSFGLVAGTVLAEELPANVNVPAAAGPTTLYTGAGVLTSAVVITPGTANLTFTDVNTGNVFATIVQPGTVGQEIIFDAAEFRGSIIANNTVNTPVVVVSILKYPAAAVTQTGPFIATFAIGSKNPNQPLLSSVGADSFGNILTSSPDNNNALQSFVGGLTNQAPMVTYGIDNYMPMPSPAYIYLQTSTPATTEVLVTVQFRRKLDRVIPDKPRTKPHTHTHVTNRRAHRTMMEGFGAQYPGEGQPYQHQPAPQQDTGVAKRAVFPLGATPLQHRGVAKNRGR